jgi:hypothetical protein
MISDPYSLFPVPYSLFPIPYSLLKKVKGCDVKVIGRNSAFTSQPSAFLHWILVNDATINFQKSSTVKNFLEPDN